MGYVWLPYRWKEFLHHEGCSFNMKSILEHGLIDGGKETKEGRRIIFFAALNPFGKDDEEEAVHGDLSVPKKLHYSGNWKHDQDAVYWVKSCRAQDNYFGRRNHIRLSYTILFHRIASSRLLPRTENGHSSMGSLQHAPARLAQGDLKRTVKKNLRVVSRKKQIPVAPRSQPQHFPKIDVTHRRHTSRSDPQRRDPDEGQSTRICNSYKLVHRCSLSVTI